MTSSLGLRRRRVTVAPHSGLWASAYEAERKRLSDGLRDLVVDIQHVGSTAVPDLCAKPIIDIAIAVSDMSCFGQITERLTAMGYAYEVDAGSEGGHIFVRESAPGITTHHVHVVELNDEQWKNYLHFRDRLRQEPALREEYSRLKLSLGQRYAQDREGYTSAKAEFINGVISRTLNEHASESL